MKWNEMRSQEFWERWDWWKHQERGMKCGWNQVLMKEVKQSNKGVDRGDYSSLVKEVRPSNTPSSRDSIEFECKDVLKKWLMEWKRMKEMEDEKWRQGMKTIEKTRWEGDKTIGGESEKKDEERNGWDEESLKSNKFGKTRKGIRWERGDFVVVERIRQSESEDGGMRELREKWGWSNWGIHWKKEMKRDSSR